MEDIAYNKIQVYCPPIHESDDPETVQESKDIMVRMFDPKGSFRLLLVSISHFLLSQIQNCLSLQSLPSFFNFLFPRQGYPLQSLEVTERWKLVERQFEVVNTHGELLRWTMRSTVTLSN